MLLRFFIHFVKFLTFSIIFFYFDISFVKSSVCSVRNWMEYDFRVFNW